MTSKSILTYKAISPTNLKKKKTTEFERQTYDFDYIECIFTFQQVIRKTDTDFLIYTNINLSANVR